MAPLLGDGAQQARRQRRQLDPLQLGHGALAEKALEPRLVDRRQGLRHQPQHEAGERRTAFAIAQPVGHEGGEVDFAQARFDRLGRQEVRLDELAEILGDAMMIARHDRSVRDRQAERPAEQGNDGIPVGQSADGRRRGKGRDIAPGPMERLVVPRHDEQHGRRHQQQRGRELDPPQRPGAFSVAVQVLAHTSST